MGHAVATEPPTWFRRQMTRMMGLRFAPADLATHWEALRDVPEAVLAEAVTRAAKSRAEFPAPVELRQDCDAVAHLARSMPPDEDRSIPLAEPFTITVPGAGTVISIHREWNYYCDACEDTGTVLYWCGDPNSPTRKPWYELRVCDRMKAHLPHDFAGRCACWDTNQALIRKRAQQQKFADASQAKQRHA